MKTKFLIDPGAEVTIMSQKLFERIPENMRPKVIKTECNVKLEVVDKGLVKVVRVADILFLAGSQMYASLVWIAPIEEEGLLGMDILLATKIFELSMKGLLLNRQKLRLLLWTCNVRVLVEDDNVMQTVKL